MPLADITNKIIFDADVHAQAIIDDAEKEASRIIESGKKERTEVLKEYDTEIVRMLTDNVRKVTASASQEARKITEETRFNLLTTLFQSVEKKVMSLPSPAYVALFSKMIKKLSLSNVQIVSVHAPENRIEDTKAILASVGLSTKITTNTLLAGLIIETTDAEYTLTINELLSRVRMRYEVEIARLLFTDRTS